MMELHTMMPKVVPFPAYTQEKLPSLTRRDRLLLSLNTRVLFEPLDVWAEALSLPWPVFWIPLMLLQSGKHLAGAPP